MAITVSYTDSDIARSVADRRLRAGVYNGKVTKSRADADKREGNMRILLTIAPVDESGNTRRPTVMLIHKLPLPTSPETLAHFGLPMTRDDGSPFQSQVPNSGWDIYNYTKATRPELALDMPKFDPSTKKWFDSVSDATYGTKAEAQKRKEELLKPAYEFFATAYANLVNDPENAKDFVGDEFVFEVSYRPGSDFPNVKILGSECPDDKVLTTNLAEATEVVGG